jgi:hypothetical protein
VLAAEDGTGIGLQQLLHSARQREFVDLKSVLPEQGRKPMPPFSCMMLPKAGLIQPTPGAMKSSAGLMWLTTGALTSP